MDNTQYSYTMRLPKFDSKDLGIIIGPNKADCEKKTFLAKKPSLRKNVLTKAWTSFDLYKEKEGIEGTVPKLFILLETDAEGVFATIKTESDKMMKFAQFHLNKYQEEFRVPEKKMVYTFYAAFPHRCIPQLIGRQAATISKMRTGAISNMDEDTDPEQLRRCETSYLKVDPFNLRGEFSEFMESVRSSGRATFVGWPPEEEEEIVKIFVSSIASKEPFDDFIAYLADEIDEVTKGICERQQRFDSQKEDELKECYEALDQKYE